MLDFLIKDDFILLIILILLLCIFTLIFFILKAKKVKPINLEEIEKKKAEKTSIEEVIDALENTTTDRKLTTFEQDQEANAIISYQELVDAVKKKKENSDFNMKSTDKQKNISLETFEENAFDEIILDEDDNLILEENIITKEEDNFIEELLEQEEKPKFKNSEFISPVFGKDNNTTDDFLKELKDLRKNL